MKSEALSKWQVLSIRVTGFFSAITQVVNEEQWWQAATNSVPEEINKKPSLGEVILSGPHENGTLVLHKQPIRVDWRYLLGDQEGKIPGVPSVGAYPDVIVNFKKLISQWIDGGNFPEMQRLAFGIELAEPVADRDTAYEKLNDYLPSVSLDVKNSRDFIYRINRRRVSGIQEDLLINRLSTWGAKRFVSNNFNFRIANGQVDTLQQQINGEEHVSLALDINTYQEYDGSFDTETASKILDELISLAEEIALEGDIA